MFWWLLFTDSDIFYLEILSTNLEESYQVRCRNLLNCAILHKEIKWQDPGTYFKSLKIIINEDTLAKDKYTIDNNNLLFITSFK